MYVCVCVCVPIYMVYIDGHLGCVHIFIIVNNVAVNIGVHLFKLLFQGSLDNYPEVEPGGHKEVPFLVF